MPNSLDEVRQILSEGTLVNNGPGDSLRDLDFSPSREVPGNVLPAMDRRCGTAVYTIIRLQVLLHVLQSQTYLGLT